MENIKTLRTAKGNLIIVSLGGSIVCPDGIDIGFLKSFNLFIRRHLKIGYRFGIVVGGGGPARVYQNAASDILSSVSDEDKDWIGIHATRLNAQLLRTIFKDVANPVVFDSSRKITRSKHPVFIASGWEPGWSTDYIAASIAAHFGAPMFINAGKPSHVFDKDPARHKDAKKFDALTWREYRRLIPRRWSPGLSSPIDPVAAKLCEERSIKAAVINGKDLKNFAKVIAGKKFNGTLIS